MSDLDLNKIRDLYTYESFSLFFMLQNQYNLGSFPGKKGTRIGNLNELNIFLNVLPVQLKQNYLSDSVLNLDEFFNSMAQYKYGKRATDILCKNNIRNLDLDGWRYSYSDPSRNIIRKYDVYPSKHGSEKLRNMDGIVDGVTAILTLLFDDFDHDIYVKYHQADMHMTNLRHKDADLFYKYMTEFITFLIGGKSDRLEFNKLGFTSLIQPRQRDHKGPRNEMRQQSIINWINNKVWSKLKYEVSDPSRFKEILLDLRSEYDNIGEFVLEEGTSF